MLSVGVTEYTPLQRNPRSKSRSRFSCAQPSATPTITEGLLEIVRTRLKPCSGFFFAHSFRGTWMCDGGLCVLKIAKMWWYCWRRCRYGTSALYTHRRRVHGGLSYRVSCILHAPKRRNHFSRITRLSRIDPESSIRSSTSFIQIVRPDSTEFRRRLNCNAVSGLQETLSFPPPVKLDRYLRPRVAFPFQTKPFLSHAPTYILRRLLAVGTKPRLSS